MLALIKSAPGSVSLDSMLVIKNEPQAVDRGDLAHLRNTGSGNTGSGNTGSGNPGN